MVGRPPGEEAKTTAEKRAAPAKVVTEPQPRRPERVPARRQRVVDAERLIERKISGGRCGEVRHIESKADREGEPR